MTGERVDHADALGELIEPGEEFGVRCRGRRGERRRRGFGQSSFDLVEARRRRRIHGWHHELVAGGLDPGDVGAGGLRRRGGLNDLRLERFELGEKIGVGDGGGARRSAGGRFFEPGGEVVDARLERDLHLRGGQVGFAALGCRWRTELTEFTDPRFELRQARGRVGRAGLLVREGEGRRIERGKATLDDGPRLLRSHQARLHVHQFGTQAEEVDRVDRDFPALLLVLRHGGPRFGRRRRCRARRRQHGLVVVLRRLRFLAEQTHRRVLHRCLGGRQA